MPHQQSTNVPEQENIKKPRWAFIAAAGMGSRMRPLTDHRPKPMVEILGAPILEHILEHLRADGVYEVCLNTHYKAEVINDFLKIYQVRFPEMKIQVFHEDELLDTGGGVQSVLEKTGYEDPFYMINGDAFWVNPERETSLMALARAWDEEAMDLLLLTQPVSEMTLTQGVGDYAFGRDGKPFRSKDRKGDMMFAGVRIVSPKMFAGRSVSKYSFLELMDQAEKDEKLALLVHQGQWHHLSTPNDILNVEKSVKTKTSYYGLDRRI